MTVVRWCKEHSLAEGERQTKEVAGRTMTVLRTREDYNGTPCIRCPSHNYRINLTTGGHVERDLQGRACEHAGKQRIHRVILDDGWIWVEAQLSFRGQKHTAMGVRGELARQAVLLNAKPPPMASITMNLTTPARSEALAPAHGRAVQRSLKDFFGATAVAAVGGGATSHASDMEF
ncbi:hypothetical protein WJX72_010104 [[Myrmecia] bisecta]|uniref:Soluble Rieske-type ferredoxin domain-containing protein n=1 Tax=[Myrmecia] bisecta TaxID=41462 RepID=A0AAW1R8M5_9CHLO